MRPAGLAAVLGSPRAALLRALAVLSLGTVTALSAFIRLPLPHTPVPLTLQTLFVLLSGAMLGAGGGVASQLTALGLLWASPQLLAAAAPGGLLGPTGGYLLAFVPAAWLVGRLSDGRASLPWLIGAMAAASGLIYVFGALQLALIAGLTAPEALWAGAVPFVPGDCLKLLVAAGFAHTLAGLRLR
jgi:biotin transport system substrate-specific component